MDKLELTMNDCENLINALQEWDDTCGPKELEEDEMGLDAERFENLMDRLTGALHSFRRAEADLCG
jgi:hypothetical protein